MLLPWVGDRSYRHTEEGKGENTEALTRTVWDLGLSSPTSRLSSEAPLLGPAHPASPSPAQGCGHLGFCQQAFLQIAWVPDACMSGLCLSETPPEPDGAQALPSL